ncbi:S8 family serine peptidase [Micromonospora sp. CPCC 205539]|uniref:S8 family peptidase n=1 Tax=Micromonospora sp. CPCC 205539 TaxID=3122408 RepID=UPI002FEF9A17
MRVTPGSRRPLAVLAALVAMATATAVAPPPAAAGSPLSLPAPAGSAQTPPAQAANPIQLTGVGAGPHTVTLVTGDKVTLSSRGGPYAVEVEPALRPDGKRPQFVTQSEPDGVYVLPTDAMPAVQAGRVDRELFDVKYLVENGYADARTAKLPVIVQYAGDRAAKSVSAATTALPASTPTHQLESIHGAALDVAKQQAESFWTAVRGDAPAPGQPATARTNGLRGGITKLWLDRKVTVKLDYNLSLIGAPKAWAAGHDGTGVKVAVLDTGIDATHPDLAGRIATSRSFVPGEDDVRDGHGHGTHVAATVAGSGAASGNARKGVAPGAQLVVGKVLNAAGEGDSSWIIEGMEWAATSGAKVVSMSLGGSPTDGSDPMSEAVNALTASTGTLFVIAAGNAGAQRTIGAPGAATAALTVAATGETDLLAGFSSQGPRLDGALKPDIAAPGIEIVAARAAGTTMGEPVDERYTSASGTSMATPHVAGAAAILAQQHPDWPPAQLKSALMSTSKDAGHTAYQQGAGRLDIARVDRQRVFATTPNVDYGMLPATEPGTTSRQVSYANLTDEPVTLALATRLADTKGARVDGALRTEPTVTVPANGTATVTVTADLDKLGEGMYTGAVVATAGEVRLTTPVGLVREPEKFALTVRTLGRTGQALHPIFHDVIDVADSRGRVLEAYAPEPGVIVQHVPAGTYSVAQLAYWVGDDSRVNYAWLFAPEVTVTGDTEVVVDARQAQEITFHTPRPAQPLNNNGGESAYQRTDASGQSFGIAPIMGGPWGAWPHVLATPTKPVKVGKFRFRHQWTLGQSELAMRVRGAREVDLHPIVPVHWETQTADDSWLPFQFDSFGWTPFRNGNLPLIDAGRGRPEDLAGRDLRGKLALLETDSAPSGDPACYVGISQIEAVRDAGAAGLVVFPSNAGCAAPVLIAQEKFKDPRPANIANMSLSTKEGFMLRDRLAGQQVTIQTTVTPETPYTYVLNPYEEGRVPASLRYTFTERQLARVDLSFHADKPTRMNDYQYTYKQDDLAMLVSGTAHGAMSFTAPRSRVEYVGPLRPDVISEKGVSARESNTQTTTEFLTSVHDRPTTVDRHWFADPHTPGPYTTSDDVYDVIDRYGPSSTTAVSFCMTCRQGNGLVVRPTDASANRGDRQMHFNPTDREMRLSRDGVDITPAQLGIIRVFPLSDGPGRYRLTSRNAENSATWTFSSAPPTKPAMPPGHTCLPEAFSPGHCRPEPLVYTTYDLGSTIDLNNTVSARGRHTFRVNAFHERSSAAMPAIAGLKLWKSTDEGRTWEPVQVKRDRTGSYLATTTYGHAAGKKVSLKVEAWDTAGNRLEQTTLRAFTLRTTGHRDLTR